MAFHAGISYVDHIRVIIGHALIAGVDPVVPAGVMELVILAPVLFGLSE